MAMTARRLRPGVGLGVFAGYLTISIVFWGQQVVRDPTRKCLCLGDDPSLFMWSLSWWPHAIGAGTNPFVTHAHVRAGRLQPDLGDGRRPIASLAVWPVTALAGPVAAWNACSMLGAPALAAFTAFALCRELTGRFGPSLVGGYLFGFSSFMLAESLAHLHLTLSFPLPWALLLAVRRFRGGELEDGASSAGWRSCSSCRSCARRRRRSMLAVMSCAGAAAGLVFADSEARRRIVRVLAEAVAASSIAAVVLSPYLYYAFKDVRPDPIRSPYQFSGDALNLLIPTEVTRLGHRGRFAPVADHFLANAAESGLYLGLPIVVLVCLYALRGPAGALKRSLLAFTGIALLFTLGPSLQIAGQSTLKLPWREAMKLPLLNNVLPVRFALYLWLAVAVIVALWLALPRARLASWSIAALGLAFLVPSVNSPIWHTQLDDPPFFRDGGYRQVLRPDETILALPMGSFGFSMLWAAETHIDVRLAGGYIAPELPDGYANDPFVQGVYAANGNPPANLAATLPAFLQADGRDQDRRERGARSALVGGAAGPRLPGPGGREASSSIPSAHVGVATRARGACARRGVPSDGTWHPRPFAPRRRLPRKTCAPAAPASTRWSCSIAAAGCCRRLVLVAARPHRRHARALRGARAAQRLSRRAGAVRPALGGDLELAPVHRARARAGVRPRRPLPPARGAPGRRRGDPLARARDAHHRRLRRRGRRHDVPQLLRHLLGHVRARGDARAAAARELRQRHAGADAAVRHAPPHAARRAVRRALACSSARSSATGAGPTST